MTRAAASGRWRWLVAGVALLVLAGCGGIPSSSAPQVVRSIRDSPTASIAPRIVPQPGAGPDELVREFVQAGVDADAGHSKSRQFLTTAAARRWQDNQTVVLDETNFSDPAISGDSATVTVTGRRVGQLDANGVFAPILKGMGTGDQETFNFSLTRSSGQWRIDQLQPGVLVSAAAFTTAFHQRQLFFFDSAQRILVPDLRYTPLQGGTLASWLLAQLVAGPRAELAQTLVNEVPSQVGKPTVQPGNPMTVEMPGTAQLDASGRNGLAAQLAFTLGQVQYSGGELELTDNGKAVRVPAAPSITFSIADFNAVSPDSVVPGVVPYWVHNGAVVDSKGVPLPNALGQARNLSSVALRRNSVAANGSGDSLLAAGLTAEGQLLIGSARGLTPVALRQAATSRPDWRPFSDDVWLGAGVHGGIYRVTAGQPPSPVSISSQVGPLPAGRVVALRISSDGERIAIVLRGAEGGGSAWVGSVVTSGSDVRIDSLEPITPPSLAVTDLAWADPTKLLLVAAAPGAEARMWQVFSDGSMLDEMSNVGLPGPPTSITASQQQPPLVSAANAIWAYNSGSWSSISGTDSTVPGSNPVYAP
ncbi:MAG TPA: hypothetical protein VMB79_09215 [Jatrophihabitans sp.]|nr:hypothetical protein [Jatrophihabitans sp.]